MAGRAIVHAAQSGNTLKLKELLEKSSSQINQKDASGSCALHWASRKGHLGIVNILVSYGADITLGNNEGMSAEDLAKKHGHKKIQKALSVCRTDRLKPQKRLIARVFAETNSEAGADRSERSPSSSQGAPGVHGDRARSNRTRTEEARRAKGGPSVPSSTGDPRARRPNGTSRADRPPRTKAITVRAGQRRPSQNRSRAQVKAEKLKIEMKAKQLAARRIWSWYTLIRNACKWRANMNSSLRKPVWFVMGAPGSGKSSLVSALLGKYPAMIHVSVGQLVLAEVEGATSAVGASWLGSRKKRARELREIVKQKEMIPVQWVVDLMCQAIFAHNNPEGFIIEDFPRTKGQASLFEQRCGPPSVVLYLDCPLADAQRRLLATDSKSPAEVKRSLQLFSLERVHERYVKKSVYHTVQAGDSNSPEDVLTASMRFIGKWSKTREEAAAVKLQAGFRGMKGRHAKNERAAQYKSLFEDSPKSKQKTISNPIRSARKTEAEVLLSGPTIQQQLHDHSEQAPLVKAHKKWSKNDNGEALPRRSPKVKSNGAKQNRTLVDQRDPHKQVKIRKKLRASVKEAIEEKIEGASAPVARDVLSAFKKGAPKKAYVNRAFVFLKPSAVTKRCRVLLPKKFESFNCSILLAGRINAKEIDAKNVVDKHFFGLSQGAIEKKPTKLQISADAFSHAFGVGWRAVLDNKRVYNALEACAVLGVDVAKLTDLWNTAESEGKVHKLGHCIFCAALKIKDSAKPPIYVINGHYLGIRDQYVSTGASVSYYVIQWDPAELSWKDFMADVIGDENPSQAPVPSLRGTIYRKWAWLGLSEKPGKNHNAVHGSRSGFQAFAEMSTWLGVNAAKDEFGKRLLEEGIDLPTIEYWCTNPPVHEGSSDSISLKGARTLFQVLEGLDSEECIEACVRLHQTNSVVQNKAASLIQASWRGAQSRKQMADSKDTKNEGKKTFNFGMDSNRKNIACMSNASSISRNRSGVSYSAVSRTSSFVSNLSSLDEPPGRSVSLRSEDAIDAKLKAIFGRSDGKSNSPGKTAKSPNGNKKIRKKIPTLCNAGMILLDPDAVSDASIGLIKLGLKYAKCAIRSAGYISASEMNHRRIIDQHFYRIASDATHFDPSDLVMPRLKFESKFGEAWHTVLKKGRVYNALQASAILGLDDAAMARAWKASESAGNILSVGDGVKCGRMIDKWDRVVYVINGHYMSIRARYTKQHAQVYYFSVKWDQNQTSWKDFYKMVTGYDVTDEERSESPSSKSLQGVLFQEWNSYGLQGSPRSTSNAEMIYMSRSPLQGLADRTNWLDISISHDVFGKALIAEGVNESVIRKMRTDPKLKNGDRLYTQLLGLDVEQCIAHCKSVSALVNGSVVQQAPTSARHHGDQSARKQRSTIKLAMGSSMAGESSKLTTNSTRNKNKRGSVRRRPSKQALQREKQAAITIQRAWRGYAEKKHTGTQQVSPSAERKQKKARPKDNIATRMRRERSNGSHVSKASDCSAIPYMNYSPRHENAAIVIQSHYRGYTVRKSLTTSKLANDQRHLVTSNDARTTRGQRRGKHHGRGKSNAHTEFKEITVGRSANGKPTLS